KEEEATQAEEVWWLRENKKEGDLGLAWEFKIADFDALILVGKQGIRREGEFGKFHPLIPSQETTPTISSENLKSNSP
ncbi:hypothetical protein LINPERPRIM_LOCUS29089, partial [Linum perenne]